MIINTGPTTSEARLWGEYVFNQVYIHMYLSEEDNLYIVYNKLFDRFCAGACLSKGLRLDVITYQIPIFQRFGERRKVFSWTVVSFTLQNLQTFYAG